MKNENENTRKRRGATKGPSEERSMSDTLGDEPIFKGNEGEVDLPDEWISIAAYYIWKNDGGLEGRDAEYWERAKTELRQFQKEGNLPIQTGPRTLDEER